MKIIINGSDRDIDERLTCTWGNVCSLSRHGHKGSDVGKTVTWRDATGRTGELAPLDPPIPWVEGMIFNVMWTGNA